MPSEKSPTAQLKRIGLAFTLAGLCAIPAGLGFAADLATLQSPPEGSRQQLCNSAIEQSREQQAVCDALARYTARNPGTGLPRCVTIDDLRADRELWLDLSGSTRRTLRSYDAFRVDPASAHRAPAQFAARVHPDTPAAPSSPQARVTTITGQR